MGGHEMDSRQDAAKGTAPLTRISAALFTGAIQGQTKSASD
jgi:hypothetical protein